MMETVFPEYPEDKCQKIPIGTYVWTRQHSSGIWFHILFVIDQSRDQFTTEAAWGFDGKLPRAEYNTGPEVIEKPQLFRPNFLWSGKDYWWPLVLRPEEYERALLYKDDPIEQCLPLVAPAVWNAGEKLKDHLMPVFEKVVEKHGKKSKTSRMNAGKTT